MNIRVALLTCATACTVAGCAASRPATRARSTFEQAAAELVSAVETARIDRLAGITEARGVPFVYAPEGEPREPIWLSHDKLRAIHRRSAELLEEGDGGDGMTYLIGAFYEEHGRGVWEVDAAAHTVEAFACGMCELRFHFEPRGARWILSRIYVEDAEP